MSEPFVSPRIQPFEALYHGTCGACEERIRPGEMVHFESIEGVRALTHVDCEAVTTPERVAPICQTCWLAKPCACDD